MLGGEGGISGAAYDTCHIWFVMRVTPTGFEGEAEEDKLKVWHRQGQGRGV